MRLCIGHGGDIGEPSGGTDRVSALAAGLADRGADVTLVVPTPTGPVPDRLDVVECEYVDPPTSTSIARAASVARTAAKRAEATDSVLQLEHSTLAGVGTVLGVEDYVLDMHDVGYSRFDHVEHLAAPLLKRAVKRLERRALERATHVVVVSEVMAEMVQRLWDVPRTSISVVPNGYFPETIAPYRDVPVLDGKVAFLGTLHPKVDIDTLVAIAKLPEVTEMAVVGTGAQRERLEQAADRTEALRPMGRLPDDEAFETVASAQVLVNPQTVSAIQRSSSPVKLYYYAALGKPMVVTPGPSVVEALVRQGAAVTAQSRRNFVSRVRAILSDESFATRLATNARNAAESFRWDERVLEFESVHRLLAGETT